MIENPQIGDLVWVDREWDGVCQGKVENIVVVDPFNDYKLYYVENEDGLSEGFPKYALYENKSDILKLHLEQAMEDRKWINKRIAELEYKLNNIAE